MSTSLARVLLGRRVRRVRQLAPLALAAVVAGIAGAAPSPADTHASAVVVRVVVPGQAVTTVAEVAAPPAGQAEQTGWVYPADGSVVRVGTATASVAAQPGVSAIAQGIADALAVVIFGGEIAAVSVGARATAAAGGANASAEASSSAIAGLVVLGQPVPSPGPNQRLPLADWGSLEILAGSTESASAPQPSAHVTVAGLRVALTAEHGGLPAGSEITVALAEATAAAAAAVAPAAKPAAPAAPIKAKPARPAVAAKLRSGPYATLPQPLKEPGRSIPGAPAEVVQPLPEGVQPRLSTGGYVFPVYGPASFGDSFGAPRSDVAGGWHHGEDVLAPLGTPLLAVADGTVFSVGWNDIGGWRLWLRDRQGNQFYYAHLAAFSPLARDGNPVRAGDVLGFMGKTGDAEQSPPHLHFEIHPAPLLGLQYDGVIAPYPYLLAWRRAQDISFAAGRPYLPEVGGPGRAAAPPVGAMLLEARDISRTSGLVPGALERALADESTGGGSLAVPAP